MVRKIMTVCCLLACLAALPQAASAASVYDGTISTTYITIFRDIVGKIGLDDEYVFYRSGQYEYTMVAGDIAWSGGTFRSDQAVCYLISTGSSGYNQSYDYSVTSVSSWSLSPGSALVYSSLGDYPDLVSREEHYDLTVIFMLAVSLCICLIRPIFTFTMRRR